MDTESNQKYCKCCDSTKPASSFHRDSYDASGLSVYCKGCKSIRAKDYYKRNKERINSVKKEHYMNNPDMYQAYARNRKSHIKKATPSWDMELTELVVKEAYNLKMIRKGETGVDFHVDHIVPLKGKSVSGLHVWNNIQVIPAKLNLEKGNRYE